MPYADCRKRARGDEEQELISAEHTCACEQSRDNVIAHLCYQRAVRCHSTTSKALRDRLTPCCSSRPAQAALRRQLAIAHFDHSALGQHAGSVHQALHDLGGAEASSLPPACVWQMVTRVQHHVQDILRDTSPQIHSRAGSAMAPVAHQLAPRPVSAAQRSLPAALAPPSAASSLLQRHCQFQPQRHRLQPSAPSALLRPCRSQPEAQVSQTSAQWQPPLSS